MLIDSRRRFAARVVKWLRESKMDKTEVAARVSLFDKEFISLINEEAAATRKGTNNIK